MRAKPYILLSLTLFSSTILSSTSYAIAGQRVPDGCQSDRVKLQMLGTRGPEFLDGNASTGYLIWEMTDRLYTQMNRVDCSIAVMFMVDMSGSTKGWINEAERELLILLCEALEKLGDRYAIYGFSGWARKRCDIFKI